MGLARSLARRFANRGEPLDDLVQVASMALIKALDRFEPERGLAFSTFATPTILGELKRHFRDKGWAVRVARRVQELHLRLTREVAGLAQELGRSPTVPEIARRLEVSEDEVLEAMEAGRSYRMGSLDARARATAVKTGQRCPTASAPTTRRWPTPSAGPRWPRCWPSCRSGSS